MLIRLLFTICLLVQLPWPDASSGLKAGNIWYIIKKHYSDDLWMGAAYMGLFGSLFGSAKKENSERAENGLEENAQALLKGLYAGMPVTVEDNENLICFAGKLASYSSTGLSVEPLSRRERLPAMRRGAHINIRGYRKDVSSIDLAAVVKDSESGILRAGELTLVTHPEKRRDFRLPLNREGEVFAFNDLRMMRPEICTVINISQGGICISSDVKREEGSLLRLRVCLMEGTPEQLFSGTVVRVTPREGGFFEYGIRFAPLDERRASELINIIFNIQRQMRREHAMREEALDY